MPPTDPQPAASAERKTLLIARPILEPMMPPLLFIDPIVLRRGSCPAFRLRTKGLIHDHGNQRCQQRRASEWQRRGNTPHGRIISARGHMNLFSLTGKTALVTGGNGGIGLGMARGLAEAGATVAIAGRDK